MKIIVVGNGKIGELLVQQLSREGHEVVVVDSNPARLEFMQEKLDVAVVTAPRLRFSGRRARTAPTF